MDNIKINFENNATLTKFIKFFFFAESHFSALLTFLLFHACLICTFLTYFCPLHIKSIYAFSMAMLYSLHQTFFVILLWLRLVKTNFRLLFTYSCVSAVRIIYVLLNAQAHERVSAD